MSGWASASGVYYVLLVYCELYFVHEQINMYTYSRIRRKSNFNAWISLGVDAGVLFLLELSKLMRGRKTTTYLDCDVSCRVSNTANI